MPHAPVPVTTNPHLTCRPTPPLPHLRCSQGAKKTVFFATAGEKGAVKLWSSDTGACVHEVAPEVQVGEGVLGVVRNKRLDTATAWCTPWGAQRVVCVVAAPRAFCTDVSPTCVFPYDRLRAAPPPS